MKVIREEGNSVLVQFESTLVWMSKEDYNNLHIILEVVDLQENETKIETNEKNLL